MVAGAIGTCTAPLVFSVVKSDDTAIPGYFTFDSTNKFSIWTDNSAHVMTYNLKVVAAIQGYEAETKIEIPFDVVLWDCTPAVVVSAPA